MEKYCNCFFVLGWNLQRHQIKPWITANKALIKTNHPTLISLPFGGKLARQKGIETHSLGGYDATFLESAPLLDKIYSYSASQLSRLQKQEQQTPAGTSSNEMNMSQTISDSHRMVLDRYVVL